MRFLTAGESHGPELTGIIEGLPAGLPLSLEDINMELERRQKGYGRGGRMLIEADSVVISSGVRHGLTLGSPITLTVQNRDNKNWSSVMGVSEVTEKEKLKRCVTKPRPGHADLVGGMKYGHRDLRNVLERSSARETTMRVAIGAICKKLLSELGITLTGHVTMIGGIEALVPDTFTSKEIKHKAEASSVRCVDPVAEEHMKALIDKAKEQGDTIGGIVEVMVDGVPPGIGSYTQWDTKLDGKIAQALISINAFKGVEFGVGFASARRPGSQVMDAITWTEGEGYSRSTNHLGGFEGGMTNGMPLIIRGVMKPIPTLYKPLPSVDIESKEVFKASIERSDSCAVPAACVIAEAMVAIELTKAILDQFSSDSFDRLVSDVQRYRDEILRY